MGHSFKLWWTSLLLWDITGIKSDTHFNLAKIILIIWMLLQYWSNELFDFMCTNFIFYWLKTLFWWLNYSLLLLYIFTIFGGCTNCSPSSSGFNFLLWYHRGGVEFTIIRYNREKILVHQKCKISLVLLQYWEKISFSFLYFVCTIFIY